MPKNPYPARYYQAGISLKDLVNGGFIRRQSRKGEWVWFFKMPSSGRIVEIEDALVPTIEDLPVVTINGWLLDRDHWRYIGKSGPHAPQR